MKNDIIKANSINTNKMMSFVLFPFLLFPLSVWLRLRTDQIWIGILGAICFVILPLFLIPYIKKVMKKNLTFEYKDSCLLINESNERGTKLKSTEFDYADVRTVRISTPGSLSIRFWDNTKVSYDFYPNINEEGNVISEQIVSFLISNCKRMDSKVSIKPSFILTPLFTFILIFLGVLVTIVSFSHVLFSSKSFLILLPAIIIYCRVLIRRNVLKKIYDRLDVL